MRPSEDVLNQFYGLADCDDATRFKAVAIIVQKVRANDESCDYCLERLISGLSSARAAARIGYSTALTHALAEEPPWTVSKLLEQADKLLDLEDKEMASNNAIAQHLLFTAIIESNSYKKDLATITTRALELRFKFPFLGLSMADSLSVAALRLGPKEVKKLMPALISFMKSHPLKPETIYMQLLLRNHIPSSLSFLPYMSEEKTPHMQWGDLDKSILTTILKGMDKGCVHLFLSRWLTAAQEDGTWEEAYNMVLKWADEHSETATERVLRVTAQALTMAITAQEISVVISPQLAKCVQGLADGKNDALAKFHKASVTQIGTALVGKLSELKEIPVSEVVKMLETLDHKNELGRELSFDIVSKTRVTEKLIEKLDEEQARKFIERAATSQPWSLRRVMGAFPAWSAPVKQAALSALVALPKGKNQDTVFQVASQCMDSLFRIKVKPGEQGIATISEENEKIIMKLAKKVEEKWKNAEKTLKSVQNTGSSLLVLYSSLCLWQSLTPDEDEAKEYGTTKQELITVAKNEKDRENSKVLLDLLISLLGQSRRFHRTLVCLVFSSMLPTVTIELIEHVLKGVSSSDHELAGATDEDEDMEDEEDIDEEMPSEGESSGSEDEKEEESDDEEEVDDEDLADMGEVDTQLVERLQNALGKAALKEGDDDAGSAIGDEEMFKLDEGLVAAFKAIGGQPTRAAAATRFAQPLRARMCDLLLFVISSAETPDTIKVDMILPVVRATKELTRGTTKDEGAMKKLLDIMRIMAHLKKVSAKESHVLKILDSLVTESTNIANPFLNELLGELVGFLCKLCAKPNLSDKARAAFLGVFERFVKQESNAIPVEVASAAVARCPTEFGGNVAVFINYAFDESIRIFRRTEALQCALVLCRKDVLRESGGAKAAAKAIGPFASTTLNKVIEKNGDSSSNDDGLKPRFVALLLKLLQQLALEETGKTVLAKQLLSTLDALLSKEDTVFKAGGPLSKCNAACQKTAGKNAQALITAIRKRVAAP